MRYKQNRRTTRQFRRVGAAALTKAGAERGGNRRPVIEWRWSILLRVLQPYLTAPLQPAFFHESVSD